MNESNSSDQSKPKRNWYLYSQVVPGLYVLAVGLIFLLNNFGYFQGRAWGKLWPLFIIIPGLVMIFRPRGW